MKQKVLTNFSKFLLTVEGTAFLPGEKSDKVLSESEMFSGDEEAAETPRDIESKDSKRKSVFSSFFGGRKPLTTETTVITKTENDDGTQEVTVINTSELKTEETKEEGSPKSPHKASLFSFNIPGIPFGKKGEKAEETKEETTSTDATKEDVVVEEVVAVAETSTAAEATEENKEKEKHKKGWMDFNPFKKPTPKEETPTEEIQKEETTESKEAEKNEPTKTPAEEETRPKEQKDQKEHKESSILRNISILVKGKAKDETKGETTTEGENFFFFFEIFEIIYYFKYVIYFHKKISKKL